MNSETLSLVSDAELVGLCLRGDRRAYAQIVARYQQVICALTYSACGDVHKSEDLAQETFIAAWKGLAELKNPAMLRGWLRGIARNVVNNALRREGRVPSAQALVGDEVKASAEPSPDVSAMTKEEEALIWQNLAKLPEEYREPMVLFYRQQESVAAVAEALEISTDAAKQRLARGRAMLAERIERLVDRGLRGSGPASGFATAVVAALPGAAVTHAAASLTTTAAKSGAAAKTAGILSMVMGAVLGPIVYLGGVYLGYRIGTEQAIADEERRYIRRFNGWIVVTATVFSVALAGEVYLAQWLRLGMTGAAWMMLATTLVYGIGMVAAMRHYMLSIRKTRARLIAESPEMAERARQAARRWTIRYQSKWRFLGLPLIDVNIGGHETMALTIARGWIAIGGKAYGGLIAIGAIAVGPLSWGAFSVGILTYGAFAGGVWAIGAMAFGWKAIGVCAIGWHGAEGVLAVAYRYALGAAAIGRHANDARAQSTLSSETFFNAWERLITHQIWMWLCGFGVIAVMYQYWQRGKRAAAK